ncbi:uncharacterized protein MYCFIDRAFT_200293 [Pseudocercospora fijiensis CIRAD86]|uniref:Uncharacterized protein n=1 Tax=Pseudocercospora fijiensis (strain CIRAD86) TaxID=383855 RepID=M3AL79_PSEFD|nr:uncharacterized protein MYCFIDRAFT_200293 [Pseudocercospora fijiensis CIRAD86]EME77908.1 hypothetical protein MYCFIDRAFT_200293 [Pseudocercospora fijiensis CIRAD86]
MGNLTEPQKNLLFKALFYCVDAEPKINYKKLAEMCDYKTAASATTAYHKARKNAQAGMGGDIASSPAPEKVKGAAGKKRAASTDDGDDEEPTPKKRGGKKAKTEKINCEPEDQGGDDAMNKLLGEADKYMNGGTSDVKVEERDEDASI